MNLFDVFPEFMYTLKIIIFCCCFYSRLQAEDEKNVLCFRTSNSRTKKSSTRTYFRVFTRDFHRRSENFFVANNLLIEKINRETLLMWCVPAERDLTGLRATSTLNLRQRDNANQFSFREGCI